jgi:hypothetical protein
VLPGGLPLADRARRRAIARGTGAVAVRRCLCLFSRLLILRAERASQLVGAIKDRAGSGSGIPRRVSVA